MDRCIVGLSGVGEAVQMVFAIDTTAQTHAKRPPSARACDTILMFGDVRKRTIPDVQREIVLKAVIWFSSRYFVPPCSCHGHAGGLSTVVNKVR